MRLIEHKQRILPEQAGFERTAFVTGAVARKEQCRADQIDGADDDRWPGRIARPIAVVGELATKGAEARFAL